MSGRMLISITPSKAASTAVSTMLDNRAGKYFMIMICSPQLSCIRMLIHAACHSAIERVYVHRSMYSDFVERAGASL